MLNRLRFLPYEVRVERTEGPWIKATPIWRALNRTSADTVVVHDADVFTDGLREAVAAVQHGESWAIPHRDVHRLSEDGTARLMAGEAARGLPLDQRPYRGLEGGGIVVAPRDVMLHTPPDSRYVGWGQEDHSWAMALHTLYGPAWRGSRDLLHCWHPHPERIDRKRGSEVSWQLFRRYCKARQSKTVMEALIGEARESLKSSEPELHSRPPFHL